ncbi:hypothetical protein [Xanthocytophaga flava]|uniref:hypothetical protein n=1 Tax=Xanthocytophaga flava TaxID=3048013 RepID=UPI0028D0F0E5|nr:hypothetical protein [Xanthocytophaga flavus]MDJ1466463.1 hypothetical protein [Xanthocytophaga flavus]
MKNSFFIGGVAILLIIFVMACNNYVAMVSPTDPSVLLPPGQVFLPDTPLPVDSAKSDVSETDTVILPDDVILILPKLCVTGKGSDIPCNCVVDAHVKLLTSKKEILLFGKSTVSTTELLETGGQVMLTILYNGDTLQMMEGKNFTLKIPTKRTKTDHTKMRFYKEDAQTTWAELGALAGSTPEYYTITSNQLDTWLSPAYVYSEASSTVQISLQISGEGPALSQVRLFVIPSNIHSVVSTTQINGVFIPVSHLPLDEEATLIALAKTGETLWLGRQNISLQSSLQVPMEFTSVTQKELDEILSQL